jgi:hypothetical protein
MGYRSDFAFIIHGEGNPRALSKLWVWLHAQSEKENDDPNRHYAYSGWYSYIINNVDLSKSVPVEDCLFLVDDCVKLYGFDEVKDNIKDQADLLGLEWEFVCIGEDNTDITEEASSGCDRRAWITRSITVD